jgi:hypothetical protein
MTHEDNLIDWYRFCNISGEACRRPAGVVAPRYGESRQQANGAAHELRNSDCDFRNLRRANFRL